MFKQRLKIKLHSDKSREFIQCWQSFVDHIEKTEGTSYSIKQKGENNYELIFVFQEQTQLFRLMQNEWYAFLLGGIQTLGDKCEKITTEIV